MKHILIINILVALWSGVAFGQGGPVNNEPASFGFSTRMDEDGTKWIVACVKLNPGWHVYDYEPGGDGFLIGVQFTGEDGTPLTDGQTADGQKIDEEIEDIGMVHYYKNAVCFRVRVPQNTGIINGDFHYQLCDEEKCLPPNQKTFNLVFK